jgi:hypothetical protein
MSKSNSMMRDVAEFLSPVLPVPVNLIAEDLNCRVQDIIYAVRKMQHQGIAVVIRDHCIVVPEIAWPHVVHMLQEGKPVGV